METKLNLKMKVGRRAKVVASFRITLSEREIQNSKLNFFKIHKRAKIKDKVKSKFDCVF